MRNPRAVVMLVLSVIIGLAATLVAAAWITERARVASSKVAVAAGDLELGSRLNAQMLKMVDWPSSSIPAGAFTDLDKAQDRVLKTSVQRGEPILETKLAPVGTKGGLSAVIPEGRRAMTVRVNDVVGVAGFALPGNFVDIVVNTQLDGSGAASRDKQISKIVLEQILVLAVAQEAGRDDTKPRVVNAVTLEVTPEQAEKLDLARSVGTLSLMLRNQMDREGVATRGIMKTHLFGGEPAPAQRTEPLPAPPVRKPVSRPAATTVSGNTVEMIHGTQKSTYNIPTGSQK